MKEHNRPVEIIEISSATRDVARQSLVDYIRDKGCPDGILCRNDDLAIGAYRALCDLKLELGRDVLLIGCDGVEDTRFMPCPLATISLPIDRMCELAWQFIEERVSDPSLEPRTESLTAKLDVRESAVRRK